MEEITLKLNLKMNMGLSDSQEWEFRKEKLVKQM